MKKVIEKLMKRAIIMNKSDIISQKFCRSKWIGIV